MPLRDYFSEPGHVLAEKLLDRRGVGVAVEAVKSLGAAERELADLRRPRRATQARRGPDQRLLQLGVKCDLHARMSSRHASKCTTAYHRSVTRPQMRIGGSDRPAL